MSKGRFILSLDCEGKWGVADHLTADHHRLLTDERLREAYSAIAHLLDEFGIAATFAFTECFLLPRDELVTLASEEIAQRLPYAKNAFDDLLEGSRQGWSAPWCREIIGDRHEIACHGITHTPWGAMTADDVRFELGLLKRPAGQTFVYPRNDVAHTDVLLEHGFVGYRKAVPRRTRWASLTSELNPFVPAETDPPRTALQRIPAGYFVNWMAGARRLVPTALTRLRARRLLRDAARRGAVAHYWTHPENIASAPQTFANLRAIVEEAALLRDRGEIEIVTQVDYCRSTADAHRATALPGPVNRLASA